MSTNFLTFGVVPYMSVGNACNFAHKDIVELCSFRDAPNIAKHEVLHAK